MRLLFPLALAMLITSCSPTRHIIPLKENEQSISLGLGGPLITYSDMVIPVPMLSAAYGYGLDTNITLYGGANITSALFGVLQADIGARYNFGISENGSRSVRATLGASLNPAIDVWEGNFKLWPELMAATYWNIDGFVFPYAAFGAFFEPSTKRAHGQDQPINVIPLLCIGLLFQSTNWDYGLEWKIIAPGTSNKGTVVEYRASGDEGASGIYFSIGRRFGL